MKIWIPVGIAVVVTAILVALYFGKMREPKPVVPTAPPTAVFVVPTPAPTSLPNPVGLATAVADPGTLTLAGWNVESGGALQSVVADRIASFDGVDIWGLSEVLQVDAEAYEFGAEEGEGADFASLLGTTGGADRLLLIWNAGRFEQTGGGELHDIALGGRAPLYVQLRNQTTLDELIILVNHLHRANATARSQQAQLLNDWAGTQDLPLIALGDYNFDWDLKDDLKHDIGYDLLVADGVWHWVRPNELVTTQCSGWPCRYRSVLDFVFVAGDAQNWPAQTEIVAVENDFPDDNTTPDHRPVRVTFWTVPGSGPTPTPVMPTANGSANLRSGPGNEYLIVGRTQDGRPLTVVARDQSGDWLQLAGGEWIATFFVRNAPQGLPVAAPIPTPEGTPSPAPVGPRLGELSYDGTAPRTEADEYIEIVNEGAALNLAGWVLMDDDGSRFVFPEHTMQPGDRCRVYTNEIHPESCGFSFGLSRGIWTNAGDVAILVDPAGVEVDRQCWGNACR
ncbi:MAG: lamin tail domain-containing protein [Caldilineaceae bacterium]|nr:lamin tail domain-containing protein [Caldilineaceae bacterium]